MKIELTEKETEISCLELEVSGMAITNYITRPDCVNWIEYFVCKVLEEADIHFNNVIIIEISFSEKIHIKVDNIKYFIIILNSEPVKYDCNGKSCCNNISYELYKMVPDELGSHSEKFHNGNFEIYL